MKRLLVSLTGLSLIAMSGAAAAAPSDQKSVPVTGNVASLCVLGVPNPSSVDVGQMAQTSGAGVGAVAAISERDVSLPASFCNYAGTQLTVQSSALIAADTSAVQSGFSRAVNFTSTVTTWATAPATVTTASDATGANAGVTQSAMGGTLCSPKLTTLNLALTNFTAPSNALLVAGGYAGTVTITLGPSTGGCGT